MNQPQDATPVEPTAVVRVPVPGKCNSPRKGGRGLCGNEAGKRTNHHGQGRCYLHGGNSVIKHGRYSKILRPRIAQLLAELGADPNPLDIMPEAQLLRAITIELTEKVEETGDIALLLEVTKTAESATRCVERIWKMQQTRSVPFGVFAVFRNAFVTDVLALCTPEQRVLVEASHERHFAQLMLELDRAAGAR